MWLLTKWVEKRETNWNYSLLYRSTHEQIETHQFQQISHKFYPFSQISWNSRWNFIEAQGGEISKPYSKVVYSERLLAFFSKTNVFLRGNKHAFLLPKSCFWDGKKEPNTIDFISHSPETRHIEIHVTRGRRPPGFLAVFYNKKTHMYLKRFKRFFIHAFYHPRWLVRGSVAVLSPVVSPPSWQGWHDSG